MEPSCACQIIECVGLELWLWCQFNAVSVHAFSRVKIAKQELYILINNIMEHHTYTKEEAEFLRMSRQSLVDIFNQLVSQGRSFIDIAMRIE